MVLFGMTIQKTELLYFEFIKNSFIKFYFLKVHPFELLI